MSIMHRIQHARDVLADIKCRTQNNTDRYDIEAVRKLLDEVKDRVREAENRKDTDRANMALSWVR